MKTRKYICINVFAFGNEKRWMDWFHMLEVKLSLKTYRKTCAVKSLIMTKHY